MTVEEVTHPPSGQVPPAASSWPPTPNMASITTMTTMTGAPATPSTAKAVPGPRRPSPPALLSAACLALAWAAFLAAATAAAGRGTRLPRARAHGPGAVAGPPGAARLSARGHRVGGGGPVGD